MSTLPTKDDVFRMALENLQGLITVANNYRRRVESGPESQRRRAASIAREKRADALKAVDEVRRALQAWAEEK